jgi:hypothetical protein
MDPAAGNSCKSISRYFFIEIMDSNPWLYFPAREPTSAQSEDTIGMFDVKFQRVHRKGERGSSGLRDRTLSKQHPGESLLAGCADRFPPVCRFFGNGRRETG